MSKLDDIREQLKRPLIFTPNEPISRDLLIQISNDLAISVGMDPDYFIELFEDMSGSAIPGSPEEALRSVMKVIGSYLYGCAVKPDVIRYVSFCVPGSIFGGQLQSSICDFAVLEAQWPRGTRVVMGPNPELNFEDQRAYILKPDKNVFLIPYYGSALWKHIDEKNKVIMFEDDDDGMDEIPF
jgi:hypothetical protein